MSQAHAMAATHQHDCVISVGSNIDPHAHYAQAIDILSRECKLIGQTDPIMTSPVGFQDQPDFLNSAILIRTALERCEFKAYLREVEDRLGRVRGPIKSGPRTMDLDIVGWDGVLVDEGYLQHAYVRQPVDRLLAATGHVLGTRLDADHGLDDSA